MPTAEGTVKIQVSLATPWASAFFRLARAVIPGSDNVLIIENKALREGLGFYVMVCLKSVVLPTLGQNAEILVREVAVMAMMTKGDVNACELPVQQVAVSMEGLGASQKISSGQ